ncbi:hypothetical protein [Streptomyces mayteni]
MQRHRPAVPLSGFVGAVVTGLLLLLCACLFGDSVPLGVPDAHHVAPAATEARDPGEAHHGGCEPPGQDCPMATAQAPAPAGSAVDAAPTGVAAGHSPGSPSPAPVGAPPCPRPPPDLDRLCVSRT